MNLITRITSLFKRTSSLKKILLLAAILYLFLAPLTYHPDNKQVLHWAGYEGGKIIDVWTYGHAQRPQDAPFNYPPAHYVLDKVQYFTAKIMAGNGFDAWLQSDSLGDSHQPFLPRYALAIKFGLIMCAIFIGYLIYKLVRERGTENQAILAVCLWLFNPITLYSVPIMGQNDVLALAFFFLGWMYVQKKWILASLFFGVGASVKMFPLLWLPFLLAALPEIKPSTKIKIFASSVIVYILTLVPFITNPIFLRTVMSSDLTDRFLYAQIGFGFSEAVSIVPILLMLVFAALLARKHQDKIPLGGQAFTLMVVNMLMLGFSHFHPQWWTWVVAFWSMWFVFQKPATIRMSIYLSGLTFMAWAGVVLLFEDAALTFGLFIPSNPALANLSSVRQILINSGKNVEHYVNLAHTWLGGIGAVSLALLFKEDELKNEQYNNELFAEKTAFLNKTPRWLRKVGFVLFLVLCWVIGSVAVNFIPAPPSSDVPTIVRYEPVTHAITTEVNSTLPDFKRVDIYFSNPGLQNKDIYNLEFFDMQKHILFSQKFSGFNVGDTGSIRFNLPIQSASKDNTYLISVAPVIEKGEVKVNIDHPLLVGMRERDPATNKIAFKIYYGVPPVSERVKNAFTRMGTIVAQMPWFYTILIILLALL